MPSRAQTICTQPLCGRLATKRGRCDQHQPDLSRGYSGQGTTTERGYGARWRKLRALILRRDHHLCQPCRNHGKLTPAKQVDHRVPKAHGGTDDPDNLQAICDDCHRSKTAREWTGGAVKKSDEWGP